MSMQSERLYQAVLRDEMAPISIRLRRTFSDWIEEKGFPRVDAGRPMAEHTAGEARLTIRQRRYCGCYTLEEPYGGGKLRTRVTYTESFEGLTAWAVVTVEQLGESVQAYAPGFVQPYLRTARITDGRTHLVDTTWVLSEDDIDLFVKELIDPQRRVPIVVVSPDGRGLEESRAHADYLAAAIAGTGVVALLADLRTQDRFNRALGGGLEVYGGGIRTYYAPLDPADWRSPSRHLATGGHTARSQGRAALDRIADRVIGHTAQRQLPDDVRRTLSVVYRVLAGKAELSEIAKAALPPPPTVDPRREELRRRLMAMTVRPAPQKEPEPEQVTDGRSMAQPESRPATEATAPPDLTELARAVADTVVTELHGELESAMHLAAEATLGVRESELLCKIRTLDAHLSAVYRLVAELRRPEPADARLAGELEILRAENERLQEEYAEAIATARKHAERIRWLERKLAEAGQPVYGVEGEDVFEPDSLMEMLNTARESLTHVVIGDTDDAAARLDLAHPAQRRTWAAKAWDALCALEDFARARSSGEFAGGFYEWCANGPAGRHAVPTGMLAMRESRTVTSRPKFSEPRTFPVPESVDPSGQVVMEAHIKLRPVGYPAPRIYFYDDSGGATGKIYVGYIGDHLPNTPSTARTSCSWTLVRCSSVRFCRVSWMAWARSLLCSTACCTTSAARLPKSSATSIWTGS